MANSPRQRLWAFLLIAATHWANPAAAHDEGDELIGPDAVTVQRDDAEDDIPMDADFERRAGQWRQWLQQREEERRRDGLSAAEMPEERSTRPLGGGKIHTPKRTPRGIHAETKSNGRQHHILGLGRPMPQRDTPPAKPSKQTKPPKSAPSAPKKAPKAKKAR